MKKLLILVYLLSIIIVSSLAFITNEDFASSFVYSLFYWIVLFLWLITIQIYKAKSKSTFKISIYLFLISAVFSIITLEEIAETIMKLSMIGVLLGVTQSVFEYRKLHVKR